MKNFNFKKFSFFIIFVSLINLNNVKSDEFWSNKVDGPITKDQAIKLLEGKSLDPIEGLWSEESLGTILIFKDKEIFKVYIVDGPTDFNGTWEATILKRGNEYDFLSRIWYTKTDGYRFTTQTGYLEVYDNYFLTKHDSLSDEGVNMDSRYVRIWPTDNSVSTQQTSKSDLDEEFYKLNWFNLDDPKNHWVEIANSNSEVNILKSEIYLKGQENINAYSNLLFGNDTAENDLLIVDNEDYDYSIYINYKDEGYVSIDDWKDVDPDALMQELKDTAKEKVVDVKWVFEPEISDKNYVTYSYETIWEDGDKSLETNIISLGRKGYNEVVFVFGYDDDVNAKELEGFAKGFADTIDFKEGFRYADYKSGDKTAAVSIGGLVAGTLGVKALAKAGVLTKLLAFAMKFWWVILAPVVAFFTFLNKKKEPIQRQVQDIEQPKKVVKKRKSRSKKID